MPGIEPGELPVGGVGGHQLEATAGLLPSVGGLPATAGMRRLLAHDDPQPGDRLLPAAEVQRAGQVDEDVLDLFARIVTVSLETMQVVDALPPLDIRAPAEAGA